jgi:lysophospholipase L1-like esterase
MAVGASTTFDVCAGRDHQAWPARLEHWLGVVAPGRTFQVINAGVPGYLMLHQIIRLQNELHVFAPDVILLYAGHNNLARGLHREALRGPPSTSTPDAMPTATPWGDWLSRNSLLYPKVLLRLQAMTGFPRASSTPLTAEEWERGLDRIAADFKRDLVSFVLIARSMGIRVVLLEVTHVADGDARGNLTAANREIFARSFAAPPEVTLEGYRRMTATTRFVADTLGTDFVPVRQFAITEPEFYCPGDSMHFSGRGADRMGHRLAEALISTGALRDTSSARRR